MKKCDTCGVETKKTWFSEMRSVAECSACAGIALEQEYARREHVGLILVSGALAAAGDVPVPSRPEDYGAAVRALVAQRDAERKLADALAEALEAMPADGATFPGPVSRADVALARHAAARRTP